MKKRLTLAPALSPKERENGLRRSRAVTVLDWRSSIGLKAKNAVIATGPIKFFKTADALSLSREERVGVRASVTD